MGGKKNRGGKRSNNKSRQSQSPKPSNRRQATGEGEEAIATTEGGGGGEDGIIIGEECTNGGQEQDPTGGVGTTAASSGGGEPDQSRSHEESSTATTTSSSHKPQQESLSSSSSPTSSSIGGENGMGDKRPPTIPRKAVRVSKNGGSRHVPKNYQPRTTAAANNKNGEGGGGDGGEEGTNDHSSTSGGGGGGSASSNNKQRTVGGGGRRGKKNNGRPITTSGGGGGNNDNGGTSARGVSTGSTTTTTTEEEKHVPRFALIYGAISLLCFLIFGVPRLLFHSGVTDTPDVTDVIGEYINQNVRPELEKAWEQLMTDNPSLSTLSTTSLTEKRLRPGYKLAQEGASLKYPIVMVPGFVTSALELWEGEECAMPHFRQRLWGGLQMARAFMSDRDCWLRHIALDPITGIDPVSDVDDGNGTTKKKTIRLRAAQGFEAADYFMSTYWVFGKLIENLADVGYDGSTMAMMSYDWRLAFPLLEERDGYLTKLKMTIESFHKTRNEKVVLISHSMGGPFVLFFLEWVCRSEKDGGGGGGKSWVEKHIHTFINVAGPMLGVPKATAALLSGEMKDTALLGQVGDVVERFFGRKKRKDLFSTWGALWALLPKGGNGIWDVGADLYNETTAVGAGDPSVPPTTPRRQGEEAEDGGEGIVGDVEERRPSMFTPMIKFATPSDAKQCPANDTTTTTTGFMFHGVSSQSYITTDNTMQHLRDWGSGLGHELSASKLHAFGTLRNKYNLKGSGRTVEHWHNAAVTPLPYAPSMKLYCLYGYGIPTERAYYYKRNRITSEEDDADGDDEGGGGGGGGGGHPTKNSTFCPLDETFDDPPFSIDTEMTDETRDIKNGVLFANGDGSVPLLSAGYMCVDGWGGTSTSGNNNKKKKSALNPSNIEVITREYPNQVSFDINDPIRGGPYSSEHCDILGHVDFLEDVVKIVTDFDISSVRQNKVTSDIYDIARRVNDHPLGGIEGKTKSPIETFYHHPIITSPKPSAMMSSPETTPMTKNADGDDDGKEDTNEHKEEL